MPEELTLKVEAGPVVSLRVGESQPGDWLLIVQRGEQKAGFRVTVNGVQFEGNARFFCDGLKEAQRASYDAMRAENERLRAENERLRPVMAHSAKMLFHFPAQFDVVRACAGALQDALKGE